MRERERNEKKGNRWNGCNGSNWSGRPPGARRWAARRKAVVAADSHKAVISRREGNRPRVQRMFGVSCAPPLGGWREHWAASSAVVDNAHSIKAGSRQPGDSTSTRATEPNCSTSLEKRTSPSSKHAHLRSGPPRRGPLHGRGRPVRPSGAWGSVGGPDPRPCRPQRTRCGPRRPRRTRGWTSSPLRSRGRWSCRNGSRCWPFPRFR